MTTPELQEKPTNPQSSSDKDTMGISTIKSPEQNVSSEKDTQNHIDQTDGDMKELSRNNLSNKLMRLKGKNRKDMTSDEIPDSANNNEIVVESDKIDIQPKNPQTGSKNIEGDCQDIVPNGEANTSNQKRDKGPPMDCDDIDEANPTNSTSVPMDNPKQETQAKKPEIDRRQFNSIIVEEADYKKVFDPKLCNSNNNVGGETKGPTLVEKTKLDKSASIILTEEDTGKISKFTNPKKNEDSAKKILKIVEEEPKNLTLKPDHISPEDDCPEFNRTYNWPVSTFNKDRFKTEIGSALLQIKYDEIFADYRMSEDMDKVVNDFQTNPNLMGFFAQYTLGELEGLINDAVSEKEKLFYCVENLDNYYDKLREIHERIFEVTQILERQDERLNKYIERVTQTYRGLKRSLNCLCCKGKSHQFVLGKEGFQNKLEQIGADNQAHITLREKADSEYNEKKASMAKEPVPTGETSPMKFRMAGTGNKINVSIKRDMVTNINPFPTAGSNNKIATNNNFSRSATQSPTKIQSNVVDSQRVNQSKKSIISVNPVQGDDKDMVKINRNDDKEIVTFNRKAAEYNQQTGQKEATKREVFDYYVYEVHEIEAEKRRQAKLEAERLEAEAEKKAQRERVRFGGKYAPKPKKPPVQTGPVDPFPNIPKPVSIKSPLKRQNLDNPDFDCFGVPLSTTPKVANTKKKEMLNRILRMKQQINDNAKEHARHCLDQSKKFPHETSSVNIDKDDIYSNRSTSQNFRISSNSCDKKPDHLISIRAVSGRDSKIIENNPMVIHNTDINTNRVRSFERTTGLQGNPQNKVSVQNFSDPFAKPNHQFPNPNQPKNAKDQFPKNLNKDGNTLVKLPQKNQKQQSCKSFQDFEEVHGDRPLKGQTRDGGVSPVKKKINLDAGRGKAITTNALPH